MVLSVAMGLCRMLALTLAIAGCGHDTYIPPDAWGPDADYDAPIDVEPPTISFTRPTAGQTLSGIVVVELAVFDDTGILRVDVSVADLPLATLVAAPYQTSWDASGFPSGDYLLTATATDLAGHTADASVTITIQ